MTRRDQVDARSGHRYPTDTPYFAAARTAAGIAAFAGLWLITGGPLMGIAAVFGSAIFAVYGAVRVARSREVVRIAPDGLIVDGIRSRRLPFAEMNTLRLAYYTTRRDGENGWMEMTVRAGQRKLVVESEISDFPRLAAACLRHARQRSLAISAASERNFAVLLARSGRSDAAAGYATAGAAR